MKLLPSQRFESWTTAVLLVANLLLFFMYVDAEERIDSANRQRQHSIGLAAELRQSSDDLTRMVRTYVVTGDARFKRHFEEVLAIRNGLLERPAN